MCILRKGVFFAECVCMVVAARDKRGGNDVASAPFSAIGLFANQVL